MVSPFAVDYFDGQSSRRHPATISLEGGELLVSGSFGERRVALTVVEVGESMGRAPRILRLPDGARCELRDHAGFAAWAAQAGWQAGARRSPVAGLQGRWHWALGALAGVAACAVAAYLWLLPALAAVIAPTIPDALTRAVSDSAMRALDGELLQPTRLSAARQSAIAAQVEGLAQRRPDVPQHRLLFRNAPLLGANAFALPSGDIVILDGLVGLSADPADTAAVVAHELGHVAHHHGMRQLIQSAVVSFVAGVYLGDVSSIAASLSALLVEASYSREFEYEADAYGGRLLLDAGDSPGRLAGMLVRIERSHARRQPGEAGQAGRQSDAPAEPTDSGRREGGVIDYLSSHPDTRARVERLRAMQ